MRKKQYSGIIKFENSASRWDVTKFRVKIRGEGGGGGGIEIIACKLQVDISLWLYMSLNYLEMFLDNFAVLSRLKILFLDDKVWYEYTLIAMWLCVQVFALLLEPDIPTKYGLEDL